MANLDPQAEKYLQAYNQMPPIHEMDPKAVRDMLSNAPRPAVKLDPVSKVENLMIPVSKDEEIKCRVYIPEGQGPFPIFIYYHGGGWVLGDIEVMDASCRMLANRTASIVVSVNYRLAPEYKFPTPVEDAYTALEWVYEKGTSFNGDVTRLVVGGDSSGGNLATVVTMMARDRKSPNITAQVLIYPVTNLEFNTESHQAFAKGFGLDREQLIWFRDHYVRNDEDRYNEYASPLVAEDLSGLPPAIVITAENDVLRDEGIAYAERLKKFGVQVEYVCELGMIHGFFAHMAIFSKNIESTVSKIDNFLNAAKYTIGVD
ncbi:esterase [Bacillus pseudomycoides]|uniref:Esterase n=2 Tax=Bacillaceae TaxID=186817 RepID=A0AA91VAY2_9BACI|nr:alpha/beta hydrolase [Bacillus sp. AFS014408]PEB51857.1 esterase [Bacillus sp. AFS098217]PED81855.1 esterase [Bacillus pseudomycoides]PEU17886.1 esterase [Bacillus sp. AFS019443]PFW63316.1 esterase [Bacillus sp. AFS075034]PEU15283.1 esterase [Bacillus sp. AFS014408]